MILNSRYPTQCTVSLQNHVFNANPDVVPENQDSLGGGSGRYIQIVLGRH